MAAMNHKDFKVSEQYAHSRAPSSASNGSNTNGPDDGPSNSSSFSGVGATNGSSVSGVGAVAFPAGGSCGRRSSWFGGTPEP